MRLTPFAVLVGAGFEAGGYGDVLPTGDARGRAAMDAWCRETRGSRGTRYVRTGREGMENAGQSGYGAEYMRLTIFWERMADHFGAGYADSFARDHVMSGLGGRTVHEALDAGWSAKEVWRVVCSVMDVPPEKR